MTSRGSADGGVVAGRGWTLRDRLRVPHRLLAHSWEGEALRAYEFQTNSWQELCACTGRFPLLSVKVSNKDVLIFPEDEGITWFDFATKKKQSLVEIDFDRHEIVGLWASPDGDRLYYIVGERNRPWSELVKEAKVRGSASDKYPVWEWQFYALKTGANEPEKLLDPMPHSWTRTLDTARRQLLCGMSNMEFWRLDLLSLQWQKFGKLSFFTDGIVLGGEGRLLAWGSSEEPNAGLRLIDYEGRLIHQVADFGRGAEISPASGDIGFLSKDGVWIARGGRELERVASFVPRLYGRSNGLRWCACGDHFVVLIPWHGVEGAQSSPSEDILLVGNARTRELSILDQPASAYLWS